MLAALTNRHLPGAPDAMSPTSRGQLCLDALTRRSPHEAATLASELASREHYSPFSLVTAGTGGVWLVSNVDAPVPRRLSPGWHFLANGALDDLQDPRVARAASLVAAVPTQLLPRQRLTATLAAFCRDHGQDAGAGDDDSLCVHHARAGTRSATILLFARDGHISYLHADGPPCQAGFVPVPLPWQAP